MWGRCGWCGQGLSAGPRAGCPGVPAPVWRQSSQWPAVCTPTAAGLGAGTREEPVDGDSRGGAPRPGFWMCCPRKPWTLRGPPQRLLGRSRTRAALGGTGEVGFQGGGGGAFWVREQQGHGLRGLPCPPTSPHPAWDRTPQPPAQGGTCPTLSRNRLWSQGWGPPGSGCCHLGPALAPAGQPRAGT